MNRWLIVIIITQVLIISWLAWDTYNSNVVEQYVYVDNQKVFQEFNYKKELEKEWIQRKNVQQKILDSLKAELILLEAKYKTDTENPKIYQTLQEKYQYFQGISGQIEDANMSLNDEYSSKIWTQINQYTKDFAAENNYKLILGATGDGSLMYADPDINVTDDVIAYINNRYEGN